MFKHNSQRFNDDDSIESIDFLSPAKVTIKREGKLMQFLVFVNLRQREVFGGDGVLITDNVIVKAFFNTVQKSTEMPENSYEAGEEVYDRAVQARSSHDDIYDTQARGNND